MKRNLMRRLSRSQRINLRFGILETLDKNLRYEKDTGLMIYLITHNLMYSKDEYDKYHFVWDVEKMEKECDEFWDSGDDKYPFEKIVFYLSYIKLKGYDFDEDGNKIGELMNDVLKGNNLSRWGSIK